LLSTAIIGYGHVGRALVRLFPTSVVYDKYLPEYANSQHDVNAADVCFVCVPTPSHVDGAADITEVEEVLSWVESDIVVVKSTVPPGTIAHLRTKYHKRVVFSPEYYGESTYQHRWSEEPSTWPFVIVGGRPEDTRPVVELFARALGTGQSIPAGTRRSCRTCQVHGKRMAGRPSSLRVAVRHTSRQGGGRLLGG
jgi:UDPglucose 6-dehydrogenase